jgi:hypothetical protein
VEISLFAQFAKERQEPRNTIPKTHSCRTNMDVDTASTESIGQADKPTALSSPSQAPFHLRLPDVTPPKKVEPPATADAAKPVRPIRQSDDSESDSKPAVRIGSRRSDEEHEPSAEARERMREKRRQLFGGLWVVSILLTVLSVFALVIEVVQYIGTSPDSFDSEIVQHDLRHQQHSAGNSAATEKRSIVRTSGQVLANAPPDGGDREQPVRPAMYTTDKKDKTDRRPGAWLDGTIEDDDSDKFNR